MERSDLELVLSPAGQTLLETIEPFHNEHDIVTVVSRLRRDGHSPQLVAAVMTQIALRRKAHKKFGPFAARMLFTEAGLEQATRLRVAAHHAERFRQASLESVADLGCGIGGDALALAGLDLNVTAVDRDEVTAAIAAYNLNLFPRVDVLAQSAEEVSLKDIDGVYLDPARRSSGHAQTTRLTNPGDYTPSLDFAFTVAKTLPTGVKLGPGFHRENIPTGAEAQWVSDGGSTVELGLWFGALARHGVRRSALIIRESSTHELTAGADSPDEPVGRVGEYLYEPDGAIIRARLIGDVARSIGGRMISPDIAYISSDTASSSPFVTGFRILEELPAAQAPLKKALRERGIGTLEIKKRGVETDPAVLRRSLSLRGSESATLFVTRVHDRHVAFLAERLTGAAPTSPSNDV